MKVLLTPAALDDLAEIARWIASDNPARSVTLVEELSQACQALAKHPNRFPIAVSLGVSKVRKRQYRGYLILYRVASQVEIIQVVHGARDWMSLLTDRSQSEER